MTIRAETKYEIGDLVNVVPQKAAVEHYGQGDTSQTIVGQIIGIRLETKGGPPSIGYIVEFASADGDRGCLCYEEVSLEPLE